MSSMGTGLPRLTCHSGLVIRVVGIKRIDTVVLGRDEDDVVRNTLHGEP